MQKVLAYYKEQVDDVHERKVKFLHNLETNEQLERELEAIRQTLLEHEGKLKKDKWEFTLETLDGDEAKWKEIRSECNKLLETTKSLSEELNERIVGDQMIRFKPSSCNTRIESSFGHLGSLKIDLAILSNDAIKHDLIVLCELSAKKFKRI